MFNMNLLRKKLLFFKKSTEFSDKVKKSFLKYVLVCDNEVTFSFLVFCYTG